MTQESSGAPRAPRAPVSQGAKDLLDTVASFWPDAVVGLDDAIGPAVARFHFVPNAERPRLLVPGTPRLGAARTMLRFSTTLSVKETLGRSAAAAVFSVAGPVPITRGVITVRENSRDNLAAHLASVLGEPVSFAVTIGNPRVNRKPVLQIFDAKGRTLAFAKVGNSEVSCSDVRGEAANLARIAGRLEGFEVPRVMSLTEWRGMVVMLISAIRTVPQNPLRADRIPVAAMDSFSRQLGTTDSPLTDIPKWVAMRSAPVGSPSGARLADLMSELERMAAHAPDLLVGSWHGDWTGWNMALRGRTVQLWDFERLESGVVHGMDPFHYAVNTETLRYGITVKAFQAGLTDALRQVGDDARQRVIAAIYLATIADRYLRAALGEQGDLIAARAAVVLDALQWWLTRVRHGS